MRRTAAHVHLPGPELDEEQNVEGLQRGRFNGKEIARQHLLFVVPEEGAPRAALASFRSRYNSRSIQHVLNRGAVDGVAQFEEFTLDPVAPSTGWAAPIGVLVRQPNDQLTQFLAEGWSTDPAFVPKCPLASNQRLMPVQNGPRCENQDLG